MMRQRWSAILRRRKYFNSGRGPQRHAPPSLLGMSEVEWSDSSCASCQGQGSKAGADGFVACEECQGTGRLEKRGCCSSGDGHNHSHGGHEKLLRTPMTLSEMMADLDLLDEHDTPVDATHAFHNKVVGLYFTAKHCPACVRFSPELAHFAEAEREGYLTVVVSGDASEDAADSAFNAMVEYGRNRSGKSVTTTLRVPFHSPHRAALLRAFSVFAIPALHVWHPDAKKSLTAWGHTAVSFNKKKCVAQWHMGQAGWEIGVFDWLNPLPQCVSLAGLAGVSGGSNSIEYRGVKKAEGVEDDLQTKMIPPPTNQVCENEQCTVK